MDLETITDVSKRLQKLKLKLGLISQEEININRFAILQVPDSELTSTEIRQKKMLLMQKHAHEQRIFQKKKKKQEKDQLDQLKEESPKIYLSNLHDKRKVIKDKLKNIKMFKEDNNVRKSKNLRMLNVLDNYLDGKVDDYEQAENEIDVMTKELRDINSDMENYENKLLEIETEIR